MSRHGALAAATGPVHLSLHRTYISGIERGIRNVSIDNIEIIAVAHLQVLRQENDHAMILLQAAGPKS